MDANTLARIENEYSKLNESINKLNEQKENADR